VRRYAYRPQHVASGVGHRLLAWRPTTLQSRASSRSGQLHWCNRRRSLRFGRSVVRGFRQDRDLPVGSLFLPFDGQILPETRLSDHASFWDAGLPALMVTDTALFLSPNYHLPNDTINTLDFTFIAQLSKASSSRSLNFSHYSSRAAISSSGLSLALLHLPRPFVSRPRHLSQLEHHHLKHIGIDMLGIGFHGVVNHCFNPGIARTVRAFLRDGLFERIEHRPEHVLARLANCALLLGMVRFADAGAL